MGADRMWVAGAGDSRARRGLSGRAGTKGAHRMACESAEKASPTCGAEAAAAEAMSGSAAQTRSGRCRILEGIPYPKEEES